MVDSYTSRLRIVQMPDGSNDTTWGAKADAAFSMLEAGIAGQVNVDLTAANHTLTTANNASDEARNILITFSGTPGATRTVTVPDVQKFTLMFNDSDSPVILTAGAGRTAAIQPGQGVIALSDGATNIDAVLVSDVPGHSVLSQIHADKAL